MRQHQSTQTSQSIVANRRGSTLIIVVALLGMLAFIGFVFYTFAKQERANAATFSLAAKTPAFLINSEEIMDHALQTIILGPPDTNYQNILWGGRHSLLANMFGRDGVPWNGEGVNLIQDATGMPAVDMNYNGSSGDTNDNQNLLQLVDSPAANPTHWSYGSSGVTWGLGRRFRGSSTTFDPTQDLPEPDVNYNSPDINSTFLSFDGTAVGIAGANPTRVIIPTFLRPQYLRTSGTPAQPIAQWYNANTNTLSTANRVFRVHPGHSCVDSSGNVIYPSGGGTTPISRFVSQSEYSSLGMLAPFTIGTGTSAFAPLKPDGTISPGNIGVWIGGVASTPSSVNGVAVYNHDLDVDTDGDGILDSILIDLNYPPIPRSDGTLVIPLFAIKIVDLNALLNVNATGNLSGNLNLDPSNTYNVISAQNQLGFRRNGTNPSQPDNLSKSNQGLSTNEINIQRALTADPINDTTLLASSAATQLSYLLSKFDSSIVSPYNQPGRSITELANLEWLLLNVGNAIFNTTSGATTSTFQGRWGESSRFTTFLTTGVANDLPKPGVSTIWSAGSPTNWVTPVTNLNPNPDDNFNFNEGGTSANTRSSTPLDFRGSGQQFQHYNWGADGQPGVAGVDDDHDGIIDNLSEEGWTGSDDVAGGQTYSKVPATLQLTANIAAGSAIRSGAASPLFWPIYSGYFSFNGPAIVPPSYPVRWGDYQSTPNYFYPLGSSGSSLLMRGSYSDSLIDDPTEAVIDPTLMSSAYTKFYSTIPTLSPTPTYPLTPAEIAGVTNAIANDSSLGVKETFFLQASSADVTNTNFNSNLKSLMPANLGASQNAADIRSRLTSISQDRREFGVGNSIVGGLRSWEANPSFPPFIAGGAPNPYRPEFYSYLNQVANSSSPSLKLNINRWLMLDATTNSLGFAPLPEQTSVTDVAATTARQNMARDIYTLLYTFCGVQVSGTTVDADYRTATPPTAAQAKEMAQFAVNLVDSLDPDNIITAFYYDPDLSNAGTGWNTNTAYFYGPDGIQGTNDDLVVYGVERQLLAISEATLFTVKPPASAANSPMTIFDDSLTGTYGRNYFFLELQNVSPTNVTLASSTVTATNALSTADWRIRITDATEATTYSKLYLLPGLSALDSLTSPLSNGVQADPVTPASKVLPSAATFTISSQDGTDTIPNTNPIEYRSSDFRVDTSATLTGTYVPIVPATGFANNGNAPRTDTTNSRSVPTSGTRVDSFPLPQCNLDLVWDYGDGPASPSRFLVTDGSNVARTAPGSLITSGLQAALPGTATVRILLERRAAAGIGNTYAWVPVDKTQNTISGGTVPDITIGTITPPVAPPAVTATNVATALASTTFNSYPRNVPILRNTAYVVQGLLNTFNKPSTTNITIANSFPWQLQNDRDFGTLGELLQLPLYGADSLTAALAQVNSSGNLSTPPTISASQFHTTTVGSGTTYSPTIAAGRFLRPDNPDYGASSPAITPNNGNRWYRLFDFLEVPNRAHQHQAILGNPPDMSGAGSITFGTATSAGTPVTFAKPYAPGFTSYTAPTNMLAGPFNLPQFYGWPTTHGLINLNMVRHPQVLNALLDNDQLIKDPRYGTGSQFLDDASGDTARQWWMEFVKSRDSRFNLTTFPTDPVSASFVTGGLYLPGTANARPFRNFDAIGTTPASTTDSPIEDTIFRSLPVDVTANPNDARRLFEVGNSSEHFNTVAGEVAGVPLHPTARHQLLSKILNNTTTRSNTFAVFITTQYYEAVQVQGTSTSGNVTAVRIGGQLTDIPPNRSFFVIDRTGAIDQMKILEANGINPVSPKSYSFQPNTDTSGLRANMNGIRWRDLILYRQTLN